MEARSALEFAYRLARARVLMKRSDADGIDVAAVTRGQRSARWRR